MLKELLKTQNDFVDDKAKDISEEYSLEVLAAALMYSLKKTLKLIFEEESTLQKSERTLRLFHSIATLRNCFKGILKWEPFLDMKHVVDELEENIARQTDNLKKDDMEKH